MTKKDADGNVSECGTVMALLILLVISLLAAVR